jgi:hypothetical protein
MKRFMERLKRKMKRFMERLKRKMKRFMERLKRKMKQSDTVSRDGAEIRRDFLYMARGQPRATGS